MLQFKMRNSFQSQETPRVYICCHPDETDQYLTPISDAVLAAYDCIICYPAASVIWDLELESNIANMQLIVVPITHRFFSEDNAVAQEICSYASTNHIPILPIIVDAAACDIFFKKWGSYSTLSIQDILFADNRIELLKDMLTPLLKSEEPEGSWIFLSHSSADIQKVRNIRNWFEDNGHNPLAFHLKCLRTDTEEGRKELLDLIKREIDAREWFIFCESTAAHESEYVNMEREHVIKTGKKKIWTLDMQLSEADMKAAIDNICGDIRIFMSYRQKDRHIAMVLRQALVKKDFDVWSDDFLTPGYSFSDEISNKIHDCSYFIALITDGYEESYIGQFELPVAIHSNKRIIPILVGDVPVPYFLQTVQCYRLPKLPHKEDIQAIAEYIEADLRSCISGPVNQNDAYDTIQCFKKRYTKK